MWMIDDGMVMVMVCNVWMVPTLVKVKQNIPLSPLFVGLHPLHEVNTLNPAHPWLATLEAYLMWLT